jgi:TnpA family transposase
VRNVSFKGQPKAFGNLQPVLTRPINWELIRQQYDQTIKYATAIRLDTAETEAILRRFTRENLKHPTYQAFLTWIWTLESRLNQIFRKQLEYGSFNFVYIQFGINRPGQTVATLLLGLIKEINM